MKNFLIALSVLSTTVFSQPSISPDSPIETPTAPADPGSADGALVMDGHCHADFEKFCSGKRDGKGGFVRCVRENRENFSEACKAQLKERKEKRKELRKLRKEQKRKEKAQS